MRNEAANIRPLLDRLRTGLSGVMAEVLFIHDSTDGTAEVVRAAGRTSGLAVCLIHRGRRSGGLSGAVVVGLRQARGTWAVIMDGDLQHPPELVSQLVGVGQSRGLDLVVASRKAETGRDDGLRQGYRRTSSADALKTLVVNTDDAYGFPPYREMAPSIVIGQDDDDELRRKEKEIMAAAMTNVRKRGIASDYFTWADRISDLLAAENHVQNISTFGLGTTEMSSATA